MPSRTSLFLCFDPEFFFSCAGGHRVLRSFPTRRSSDLVYRSVEHDQKTGLTTFGQFHQHHSQIDRKSGSAGMPRPTSYAVFCLKKELRSRCVMPSMTPWELWLERKQFSRPPVGTGLTRM